MLARASSERGWAEEARPAFQNPAPAPVSLSPSLPPPATRNFSFLARALEQRTPLLSLSFSRWRARDEFAVSEGRPAPHPRALRSWTARGGERPPRALLIVALAASCCRFSCGGDRPRCAEAWRRWRRRHRRPPPLPPVVASPRCRRQGPHAGEQPGSHLELLPGRRPHGDQAQPEQLPPRL